MTELRGRAHSLRMKEIPMRSNVWAVALVALAFAGCANFRAVGAFGTETQNMAATVQSEMSTLHSICTRNAAYMVAVFNVPDDAKRHPAKRCESYRRTFGELALVTSDAINDYGRALKALANDDSFTLSSDVQSTASKLGAIRDADGNALVRPEQLGIITKVLDLLADVWVKNQREQGIRRLIEAKPDLVANARILRSFFVADPPARSAASPSPYDDIVGIATERYDDLVSTLKDQTFRDREPIRTRELLVEMQPLGEDLKARAPVPSGQGAKVASTIDDWIKALDTFERDALKPDPEALYRELKALRVKVIDVRDALR
jgi:hypothetical protein